MSLSKYSFLFFGCCFQQSDTVKSLRKPLWVIVLQIRSCAPILGPLEKVSACWFGMIPHNFVGAGILHDNQLAVWDTGSKLEQSTTLTNCPGGTWFSVIRVGSENTEERVLTPRKQISQILRMIAVTIIRSWQYNIILWLIVQYHWLIILLFYWLIMRCASLKVKLRKSLRKCSICVYVLLFANWPLLEIAPNVCCIGTAGGLVMIFSTTERGVHARSEPVAFAWCQGCGGDRCHSNQSENNY